MPETFDLILRGGTVINQDGVGARDIGVRGGRIAAIGELRSSSAGEEIDTRGLTILPGVIDTQVHFREPGATHKEDLETGSHAAVLGGVTSVFEMPNTSPPTTSAEALADKIARAQGRMCCDFAFWVGGTRENIRALSELESLPGVAGIKVFAGSSTGELLVEDEAGIAQILAHTRRRVAFHSESEPRLRARQHVRRHGDPASHSEWRDAEVALECTRMLLRLAAAARKPIHVLHVSTAEEMALLAADKTWASVEVTPQHLTLTAEESYPRLGTRAQMNPPLRSENHRLALWRAVENGTADILGSDHAPHTLEEKAKPYPLSPSGMPGVQTLLPLMLDHVAAGRLSLARLVDMTSAGPHRLFGMTGKGRIAVGYHADLTIVDLKARRTIARADQASRSGWSPFEGRELRGWPVGTVVRGRCVMWEGSLLRTRGGKPVSFIAC
jgi:dihydroorotase